MKPMFAALTGLVAAALIGGSGCTSQSKARQQAQAAFAAGQAQGAAAQKTQHPVVIVRGDVRNHEIPWTEDLTLAQALVAADYRGLRDPRSFLITRGRERHSVPVRELLNGRQDPLLLPGDVVDVMR